MSRGYMSQGVHVLGGKCPGVSVQGVSVWGVYVLGVSVQGVHVRGGYVLEPHMIYMCFISTYLYVLNRLNYCLTVSYFAMVAW